MAAFEGMTDASWQRESRLLRQFLIASVVAHIAVYSVTYLNFRRPLKPLTDEWNVDTDLVADYEAKGPAAQSALPKAEPNLETAVPNNLLPQLPKQFSLKEPLKEEDGLPDPDEKPVPAPTSTPEVGKNESKETTEIRTSEPPKKDVKELDPDDARRRAIMDKLRKEAKPETKKNQAAAENETPNLGDIVASSRERSRAAGSSGESLAIQRYEKLVYQAVKRHYVLPTTYKQSKPDVTVLVAIIVNARGQLVSATIEESSNDSLFDQLTVQATQEAHPFEKPPDSLAGVKFFLRFKP